MTKPVKTINKAIQSVAKLKKEGLNSEVAIVGTGLYSAHLLGVEYKTELGARNYIKRYEGLLELKVYSDKLKRLI